MPQFTNSLKAKLHAAFAPTVLNLVDESAKHQGHAGAHPEGESHFHLTISSAAFVGKSRVEQQRMIYAVLADELKWRLHALRITIVNIS